MSKHNTKTEGCHWGYTGTEGPAYWGQLCPEFSICGTGKNQSPINLTGFINANLEPLHLDYRSKGVEITNNGHCIQVNIAPGSTLTHEGHTFAFRQFHFHVPSENQIEGTTYPMEAHFVHTDREENCAVVAVMYVVGEENADLAQAWAVMPTTPGMTVPLMPPIDYQALLPEDLAHYRFNGSMTTPPCTEGVQWFVLKQPVPVSQAQVDQFARVMGFPNNRPVQPVNARPILA